MFYVHNIRNTRMLVMLTFDAAWRYSQHLGTFGRFEPLGTSYDTTLNGAGYRLIIKDGRDDRIVIEKYLRRSRDHQITSAYRFLIDGEVIDMSSDVVLGERIRSIMGRAAQLDESAQIKTT